MKIGIHTTWMDTDPRGGVATYLASLIQHLGYVDRSNDYTIYYQDRRAVQHNAHLPPHFEPRVLWPSSRWIDIPVSLPVELLRRPVDVLHVCPVAPPLCPVPFVLTIPDIAWELHPEVFPRLIRLRLSALVRLSAARARKIVTISEFAKKCIVERLGVPDEHIVVTHLGADAAFRPVDDPEALAGVRGRYRIPGPFILYVGKLQARKNIPRLLRAFALLTRERRRRCALVLVGRRTWLSSEIATTVNELKLADDVIFTGEVPREDLVLLYNAAEVFVFPSLSEGFGIPPLEAMACGTPVVASDASSLPEVVGDAGLLVDPLDVRGLARAMDEVLTAEGLRRELSARGMKRAALFSSYAMAQKVVSVYEEVFAAPRR